MEQIDYGWPSKSDYDEDEINEGVRDEMTPKSDEQIKQSLKDADPERKLKMGVTHDLNWLIEKAIEEGVDLTKPENNNLIILLCTKGNFDMVKLFIDNGANANYNDSICLERSVDSKNVNLVKLLIDNGANVHTNLDYPIRWATIYKNIKMVKILLEAGANARISQNFPLNTAIRNNQQEMIDLIKKYINK
jgi:ankyrin repeat protein